MTVKQKVEQARVAVIGLGIHGINHVASYADLGQADLVSVVDIDEARADEVAAEFGAKTKHTDFEVLFAEEELDVVSVATPDHLHLAPTLAALHAGVNVLLEKPMALSVADAEQMVEAVEASGLKLMVNFAPRWQLPVAKLRASLDRGELGRPIYAYTRMVNSRYVPMNMLSWSTQTKLPHWLLSHATDRVRWLFGSEATRVRAVSHTGAMQSLGYDTEDLYQVTVEFESGAIGNFEVFWNPPETLPVIGGSTFELVCTDGYAEIDNTMPVFRLATEERYSYPGFIGGDMYGRPTGVVYEAVRHFVNCVINDEETLSNARDGLEVTRILCAVIESAENDGEIIDL